MSPLTVTTLRKHGYLTPRPLYFFIALCLVTWAAFIVDEACFGVRVIYLLNAFWNVEGLK